MVVNPDRSSRSTLRRHNPDSVPAPVGGYSQGVEVGGDARYLYVSGQIPEGVTGEVPASFEEQCQLVWNNLLEVLRSAGMSYRNLVKVTTFLTHVSQAEANGEIRRRVLRDVQPALTVVVVQTLESRWLLEIEAVAAA